jgi:FtsZ-binding cell division protein ZapB
MISTFILQYFLQDEISELKQKLNILSHHTEQLKEDITTKEEELMKEENGNMSTVTPILYSCFQNARCDSEILLESLS